MPMKITTLGMSPKYVEQVSDGVRHHQLLKRSWGCPCHCVLEFEGAHEEKL
jgi:hypothetical protein